MLRIWLVLRPAVRKKLKQQEAYYQQFLRWLQPGRHLALDIGANEGWVSQTLLNSGLSVIAAEPDPRNIQILRSRFRRHPEFRLYPCLVGQAAGVQSIYLQHGGTALSTTSMKWKQLLESGKYRIQADYSEQKEVPVVTLDQLIAEAGGCSFVKLDVEGSEKDCIKGLNQPVPLLLFEAHLPEFIDETLFCLEKLHSIDPEALFNYASAFEIRLDEFMRYGGFKELLGSIPGPAIDIICIMSNYSRYYSALPWRTTST